MANGKLAKCVELPSANGRTAQRTLANGRIVRRRAKARYSSLMGVCLKGCLSMIYLMERVPSSFQTAPYTMEISWMACSMEKAN